MRTPMDQSGSLGGHGNLCKKLLHTPRLDSDLTEGVTQRETAALALTESPQRAIQNFSRSTQVIDGDHRVTATSTHQVDRADEFLRSSDSSWATRTITHERDSSGDPQIGIDLYAQKVCERVAIERNLPLISEEDQFRDLPGKEAIRRRSAFARDNIRNRGILAIVDPLDGSHVYAAMGQPGGFGSGAMVYSEGRLTSAFTLGIGHTFVAHDSQVFTKKITSNTLVQLDGSSFRGPAYHRPTFIIPAAKPDRLTTANKAIDYIRRRLPNDSPDCLLSALAGNPGILSGFLIAPAGPKAAFQPPSWPWDSLSFHVLASLGFPVLDFRSKTDRVWSAEEIAKEFMACTAFGNKARAFVVGRDRESALILREAIAAVALDSDEWGEL